MTHVTDILSAQSVLSTGVSEDVVWIQGRASFRSPDCLHQQARDWADSTAGGRIISRLHLITTYIYIPSISLLCKPELKDTYNVRNIFNPPSHRNISPCVIHLTISSKTHWTIEIVIFFSSSLNILLKLLQSLSFRRVHLLSEATSRFNQETQSESWQLVSSFDFCVRPLASLVMVYLSPSNLTICVRSLQPHYD